MVENLKNDFPVDPPLREGFNDTPNEERSTEELDAWWDRLFAVTNKDGSLSVRCLHGGTWDRSTWMGEAATLEEAKALGERKLAEWKRFRAKPMMHIDAGHVAVIRMRQRPDQDDEVLGTFDTTEEAAEFMKREFPQYAK